MSGFLFYAWSYGWFLSGFLAFALVIANLFRLLLLGRRRGWQALLLASLSCGALALLCSLQMVNGWVQWGDWSALEDVVPADAAVSTLALALGVALNLAALALHLRCEKRENREEP